MTKYYKCLVSDYSYFVKGYCYSEDEINGEGEYLFEYPKDWQKVLPKPTTQEIIKTIETGENKKNVLRALKQWKYQ